MMQLFVILLCIAGLSLANSFGPDVTKGLFAWSCDSRSLVPCDISHAVCQSDFGRETCRKGVSTYPDLVCMNIVSGDAVNEDFCPYSKRPQPSTCLNSQTCSAYCRPSGHGTFSTCTDSEFWACADADAPACGWFCNKYQRDVACFGHGLEVDPSLCPSLPSTTPSASSNLPKGFGYCPVDSQTTLIASFSEGSSGVLTVTWSPVTEDLPADVVIDVVFNDDSSRNIPATAVPTCSLITESGNADISCVFEFLPAVRYRSARLAAIISKDLMPTVTGFVAEFGQLMFPAFPSASDIAAILKLPSQQIGGAKVTYPPSPPRVEYPEWDSTTVSQQLLTESFDSESGTIEGWFVGSYEGASVTDPVLSDADVEITGVSIILGDNSRTEKTLSFSRSKTKCYLVVGDQWAVQTSDLKDQEIAFDDSLIPHVMSMRPVNQPSILVPGGTKNLAIACSHITGSLLAPTTVIAEVFSETTLYGLARGTVQPTKDPAFDTFVIVGPPNRNADEIFFDISDSGLESFVAGDAFLTAGGSSISVYRAVLRPENAAILRASLRGYAHIRDKLSDKESWGEEVHVGYDASPMCRFPSGRGSVVQCGVTCGTTARTCGAHGREVEPLFCVNPEWPTVVSRCELPMFDESTLLVRYDRKTLFFSGTAIEMLTSAVIAVDLPEVLKDHIDDVPTCSVTSPLSSEEWCVIDRDASRVAINLPQQNQVFTFGRIFNSSLEFSPCKAEKASFQIYLPNESNDIAHTVVPTTATQLHVHCSLTEKPVGKVLGEPHSIAFAAQTQDSSTYVSLGQLYLSFKFVTLNDVPMFGIQSVTISNLGSQLDLSTATSAHIFGGVDVDSILWPFKENSALVDNDVISITSTVTSATLAMDAGDLVGFEGAHSFAVLINGVTLHPGDVVCSPVASIDFGGGAPGTVGTGSKVLTLAKTPAPPVGTPADKSIFVVRIPAPAGRMISAVELSLALGVNNVSYASWQSGTDGSFLLAATVPIEDLWIGASAASVDMLQSALLIPTIRQGQAMSADAIKGTTATVYAPEDYTCRSTNDPYEPAECPVKPLTCYGTVTRTVMCGNATDASDPAFQACRSSPLPEAFQACVKPNAIVSSAVVEETPTSNAPGAIGIKYELDHVWGYSSLRSFEFVVHDRGLFGEISWCWLSVVDKAIPCGRDASGMIRVALPVGLREKNANVRIFRKLVITRSKSISVTLSFVDSRGEQKKEIARADLKTDSDTPMQPTTTSFGGFAPTGDGLITAWTRATSTHDFRPPPSQEITKVLMRFDFVWPEGSIVRCLSSTGDAVVGSGSPWPPHTRTLVSSASGIKIMRFSDTNTTDVVFPIFGSDEFTNVYVACIGSPIIDSDTLYNVKAFFVSDFVPINHIYAFTPSTGFSGIIDPAAPVANPQQIKNAISFSDAPDHTLSVAATKDLVTKLSGHNDLLMNARVANTKGTATVFLGVSSSLPEFTAFLSGSDAVHLSALSAYVSQALIQDNADGFEVSSSSYSTDEGYAWRCKDSSGMISACVVADRCGEEFESEHVCINLANLPETVRDIDQCVHIPLPSSIDRTNCGVAFKKASSVAFGKDGVAISFEVDVSQMPGVSTFQIQASFPSSEKLFNVECSSSSPSASVACSIATESTSLVTATVSGANIPADAASASSIASLQGDQWGKHTFTIFFKNVIMPTTSTSKVERLTVSTFMPLRPNHDLMSTGTSSLSFNSLRFSSPLVSHVVATFQPFSLNGSGTLAVTVSSPRLRPLFLAELKKINLAVEPSHKITFMHACKISVITQFDRTRWPSGYDQIVTASSTMSDRDMGYDITGFDPVFAPTDITVTCSVNPRGEDFEVRVFFTTTDDQVFRALPRTFGPAYYITPEHLPVMPSVRLLGTKVKLTYPDGPFPADTFDLALLQATQPAFKDYYLDEKDEKSAFFVIQIETNVPASLSHPVYIRHLEGYFKTAFEEPWEKAEIIPYAASTPVGQWYCAKDGAYGACASNGCHGHRGAACFFATKKQSDDSYCLHLKPPSSFDTTHCGELKCYSADGETIVDCDDETVCVRGCQDKKIAITQMATTDPSLAQVCVRSGAVVNSEMFCPRTIVRAGEYELTCAPRSECKILCTDEQGKDEQCSSINSWSTCNGTCSEIGVQSQFTVCTARSSALMGVVDDALCSHIDSGPHTRSCTPQECASWFCSPDGERNLTSCFDDGGYDDCPSSACSDSYSVSRVAVCLKEGNVVSDSECLLQKPDLLKKCPLITSSCEVAFAGECKYDSDGQEDSSFNPDCVNFGSTSTPHEIGVCSDKNGEPVASEWCGDAATVRPCSLPMCESNISYQWVSVPGTCVHANSRCASFRPVAVSCFGKLDEQQIQVSDAFCDENERPPRYVPCEAIEVVHCGAHGKCKTVPAEYEGDALPGIVMGTCECIADNYFGDTCQTRVNFTGTGVSTAQDAITFSWTLNRIVDSHSVRVTLANYDNDVASTTLFVLPASALASRAFTHAEIAGIVKPGRVSLTFSVAGAHITTLFTFNAKCSAVPEVYSCKNNGTCASSGECQCAEGYSGELCETTPCMDRACHGENTAWCSDDEGERTCQCVDYDQTESFFFDDRCISPRDCANKVSCENGGIMTGSVNADTLNVSSCKCICSQNFVGDSCEECYYDGPGVCVNGSPREGCTGCSCNKGFLGTTCSCRFVSAGITISTDAPVDFDDRSSPEARAFFRSLHTAMQYVVGSAVTATIGDVTHKTDTSLLFATILTLSTCDDFVPQAQPAEDDLTILRNALALIKAAFESGRLDDVLPENTRIDKTAGINFDDEPTCEGPDCSPPEPSKPDSSSGSNGLSTGALIGVIVGCAVTAVIVIILLLSCLCGWCCFSKPNSDSAPNEVQMSSTQSTNV